MSERLDRLWAACVVAQKAAHDAQLELEAALKHLHEVEERVRISRHQAAQARGQLHMAVNQDAGVPDDSIPMAPHD